MVKTAGGPLLFALALDRSDPRPLGVQLAFAFRSQILAGALPAGSRLPATRTIAREAGVSRTIVLEAFARLAEDGLTETRVGAGTFVANELAGRLSVGHRAAAFAVEPAVPRLSRRLTAAIGGIADRPLHLARAFTTALPAFDAFPVALWSSYVAKHWRGKRDAVLGHGEAGGYPPLRRAIAAHLQVSRGIVTDPGQIVVVNGAQHAFQILADLLLDPGDIVWFENPGAIGARNSFAASGARLVPVPVDEEGLDVEAGLARAPAMRLAFVTPSHQQPLGSAMSLRRRLALIAAAEAVDGWIVEDDYDGEFCYSGRLPPPLCAIDQASRVAYVGTFSKTLFPALRLGFMRLPPSLVDPVERYMRAVSPPAPAAQQAVLAEFIDRGHFSAHIRRMRGLYAERHDALVDAGRRRLAGRLNVRPTPTGLHTVGLFVDDGDEVSAADSANEQGVSVAPIGRYALEPVSARGFVLGFSGITPAEIERGVERLAVAIGRRPLPQIQS